MLLFTFESFPQKYKSAVEQLYHDYKDVMFYTAMSIIKDLGQAEDIVQLAFIRIMNNIERISDLPINEKKGYIVYIVRNLSIDYIRKQKRDKTISYDRMEYSVNSGESLENIAMLHFELSMVKSMIKEMDDKYSLPLILKYTLDFSHSEIAEIMNISVENAKVRCHRGRKMLIEAIKKGGVS
jgi:RNA polymerase sigma-70 factor (ECF subfamily)